MVSIELRPAHTPADALVPLSQPPTTLYVARPPAIKPHGPVTSYSQIILPYSSIVAGREAATRRSISSHSSKFVDPVRAVGSLAAVKKVVVKLDLHNDTRKRKAIKAVSTLCGIDQIVVDMKDDKMTVVGTVDPVAVVRKLRRRFCCTVHIVSVGPAKEEEKKKEVPVGPAKAEEERKKDDGGDKKDANTLVPVPVCVPCYPSHWYYPPPHHQRPCCFVYTEEDPYACVIC